MNAILMCICLPYLNSPDYLYFLAKNGAESSSFTVSSETPTGFLDKFLTEYISIMQTN